MDQEMNNMPNNEPVGAPQVAPEQVMTEQVTVAEAGPVVLEPEKPKKKSNGMLLGLILCLLLAAGGIGFGVWTMMDGNTQKENFEKQITSLNSQISNLQEQLNSSKNNSTDVWNNLSSTLASQSVYVGGLDTEQYTMYARKDEEGNLAIVKNSGGDEEEVILELDNVMMVYYVEVGNGSVPYFYIIDTDGGVSRLNISRFSDGKLEKIGDYTKIINVWESAGLEGMLIDIDGNIYKTF